jgi:hypothetical protein
VNPLTEAREALAAALEPLGVTIYGAPPEVVTPPAAVITPGSPWWEQATFGSVRVLWTVTLMATQQGANAAALVRLESLLWDAVAALEPIALLGTATTPRLLKIGPAEVAAVDLTATVHVTTIADDEPVPEMQGAPA